ncbi:MAG: hypothetical protein P8Q99_14740 [Paracoccaceae bacterium]|nr:hypothetical protein [Paracoccaceae bacterium]
MSASESLSDLIVTAQKEAKATEVRIAEIGTLPEALDAGDEVVTEWQSLVVSLERAAVDMFSLFEKRMQHHFKRGPFSKKLAALLVSENKRDLADRVQQNYLVVNVLKHGQGASYRELVKSPAALATLKEPDGFVEIDETTPSEFIDITAPGFIDAMAATILDAQEFLENR